MGTNGDDLALRDAGQSPDVSAPKGQPGGQLAIPVTPPSSTYLGYLEAILLVIAFLALTVVVGGLGGVVYVAVTLFTTGSAQIEGPAFLSAVVVIAAVANCLAVLPVLAWGRRRSRTPVSDVLGLRRAPLTMFALIVPLVFGSIICLSELDNLIRLFATLPSFADWLFAGFQEQPWLSALFVVLAAPLTEESLFRSVILGGLLRRYRPWPSLVVSSVLFSLVHLNPAQIPSAFFVGLMLGWLYLRARSLWACVAAHALGNGFWLVAPRLTSVQIPGFNVAADPGVFQPLWFDIVGLALAAVGVLGVSMVTRTSSDRIAP